MADLSIYSRAAEKYRPNRVKLLWIAEAPPSVRPHEEPRYFYFERMTRYDGLFREVMRAMFPGAPIPSAGGMKTGLLGCFRDVGAFLIDLCKDPAESWAYEKWWSAVTEREIRDLNPQWIIVVKADVCGFVIPRIRSSGIGDRLLFGGMIPFPGSGHQRRFHDIVDPLLRALSLPGCNGVAEA